MFDHVTTTEIHEHIARLKRAMCQPAGMAYTPADNGRDWRELSALEAELRAREPIASTRANETTNVWD